jgi:hypothetical protein
MKGLIALMAKQALFNLVVRAATCSHHDSVLSVVRPRNFVLLILSLRQKTLMLLLSSPTAEIQSAIATDKPTT